MLSVASCTSVSNAQGNPRLHKTHHLNYGRRLARGPHGTRQPSRLFPLPHCSLSFRMGFPGGTSGREPTCQCRRRGFDPWLGKIPWRRTRQSTLVELEAEAGREDRFRCPFSTLSEATAGSSVREFLRLGVLDFSIISLGSLLTEGSTKSKEVRESSHTKNKD